MLSVIIPTYNNSVYLKSMLASLRNQICRDFEVILVDSESSGDYLRAILNEYTFVRLVKLEENRGYAGACNAGITMCKGDLVAILNNDIELDPGWVEAVISAAERSSEYGFFATKIMELEDRDTVYSAGDGISSYCRVSRTGAGLSDRPFFNYPREVFSACGAAAVYRRELFEKTGMFDEDFFCYVEDVDIALRAQLRGIKCLYVPGAVSYHAGGASSEGSRLSLYYGTRNVISTTVKNFPAGYLCANLPKMILFHCAYLAYLTARRKGAGAYVRGLGSGLRQVPAMIRKRKCSGIQEPEARRHVKALIRETDREVISSIKHRHCEADEIG